MAKAKKKATQAPAKKSPAKTSSVTKAGAKNSPAKKTEGKKKQTIISGKGRVRAINSIEGGFEIIAEVEGKLNITEK